MIESTVTVFFKSTHMLTLKGFLRYKLRCRGAQTEVIESTVTAIRIIAFLRVCMHFCDIICAPRGATGGDGNRGHGYVTVRTRLTCMHVYDTIGALRGGMWEVVETAGTL